MAEPLKILYVMRPASGGMRSHSLGLLRNLDPTRFRPLVICPPGDQGIQSVLPSEIPVFTIDIHGEINPATDLRNAWKIGRIAKDYQVDIIHAHGYKASLLCLGSGLRRTNGHLICTFHNPFRKVQNAPKAMVETFMGGWIGRHYHYILTVSNALREEAIAQWGIAEEKIGCIYNGIDLTPYDQTDANALRRALGFNKDAILVGTTARLIPEKGIGTLILAAKQLTAEFPSLCFVVAGDGPAKEALQTEIDRQGLNDSFRLLGFRNDIPQLLSAIDIFTLPTLEEGFSIAALEAMAAGKPIVASRVGGVPEVVSEGTGILVPPGQVDDLRQALRRLILEKAYRIQLGRAGRKRVENCFSLRRMVDEHEQIYESLAMSELFRDSV